MGYKIKEIRETKSIERPMTQDDLSRLSGVSRATISKLESGEEMDVKVGTLKAIANALGVEVSDLFD